MISLSTSLAAAAIADSRSPELLVTAEAVAPEFTIVPSISVPYSIHRFRKGSNYWFATAYDIASKQTIYYKKMSGADAASDWNAGWSTLATPGAGRAYCHDTYVSGTTVSVVYRKAAGMYFRESSDGGSSWSAEALVSDHGGANDIVSCAILDEDCIYFVTSDDILFRATRSAGVWSDDSDWPYGGFWTFIAAGDSDKQHQIHARELSNGHHAIVFNGRKGDTSEFTSATNIAVAYYISSYGFVRQALGHDVVDFDYWHLLHGVSAELNGYFFGLVAERYIEKADGSMVSPDEATELLLARTKDFISWHLIPTGIYVSSAGNYAEDAPECYTAGVAVDGDSVVLALSRTDVVSNVYTTPTSSWWGETADELSIVPLQDISISRSTEAASQIEIMLSNLLSTYTDHATVKPGSIIRVYGGYSGETEQRFSGPIISRKRTVGGDKTVPFTVMDMLWRATSIKQAWPQILKGQNILAVTFADDLDVDYFVVQNGGWRVSGGYYEQYEQGVNAITLAGYDPGSAHFVKAKLRFMDEITDHRAGVIVHQTVLDSGIQAAYVAQYNDTTNKIEIAAVDTEEMTDPVVIETSAGNYNWSADTDYWILAKIQYGSIYVWTSTNGTDFTLAVSGSATSGEIGPHGYPGLYAFIDDATAIEPIVRFDQVEIFSAESYQSGSDVMEYLSGIAGADTDEREEIEDAFPGVAFSSRWSADLSGTWSVSGGYAEAISDGVTPALKLNDVSASDIITKCMLVANSEDSGIVVRSTGNGSDCYAGTVSTTYAKILKRSSSSWTTLIAIPFTFSGEVELAFVARGPYLSVYVDGVLRAMTYDTEHTSGYTGMYSFALAGTPSQHASFEIQAWYKPVDVVSVRPGDTVASIMAQLASMFPNGHFFCNGEGNVVYGVFDDTTIDLDVRATTLDMSINEMAEQVLTDVRAVGANAFGEIRDQAWGTELLGHRYSNIQVQAAPTGNICYELAEDEMDRSQRITEETVTIRGYPGLELCDIIGTAESPSDAAQPRQVLSFTEVIGKVYEMSFDGLSPVAGEEP